MLSNILDLPSILHSDLCLSLLIRKVGTGILFS